MYWFSSLISMEIVKYKLARDHKGLAAKYQWGLESLTCFCTRSSAGILNQRWKTVLVFQEKSQQVLRLCRRTPASQFAWQMSNLPSLNARSTSPYPSFSALYLKQRWLSATSTFIRILGRGLDCSVGENKWLIEIAAWEGSQWNRVQAAHIIRGFGTCGFHNPWVPNQRGRVHLNPSSPNHRCVPVGSIGWSESRGVHYRTYLGHRMLYKGIKMLRPVFRKMGILRVCHPWPSDALQKALGCPSLQIRKSTDFGICGASWIETP